MKILFTNFHKTYGGGHTTYILCLLRELSAQHECHVATPESSRLYRLAQEIPRVNVIAQNFNSRPTTIWSEMYKLRQLLKQEHYDIVHVNGSGDHRHITFASLGLANKPKIIFTKHNDHPLKSLGNHFRARHTDRIIAVSEYVKNLFVDTPYKNTPIDVIYHGIDIDYFAPCHDKLERKKEREAILGVDHEDIILLGSTAGTLSAKGWMDMVEAIALLPQALAQRCRVVIAGTQLTSEQLNQLQRLGMEHTVIYRGLLDDVRPLLLACDLGFVLSHKETLSFACRESMALGLPTIITNAGGLPENIKDQENGWIVPACDPNHLAKLLERILPDTTLLARIGEAARKTAENEFNLPLFAQNTLLCYDKALQK